MKLFILPLFMISALTNAMTGREVMELVEKKGNGFIGSSSKMTLVLIDAHNNKVERQMLSFVKESTKDDVSKSITEFTLPKDVKGTKLLTWTMKKGPNKQWLYLPNFKRIKKINSSSQAGSFMGSEFSYEDIAGQEINKYKYTLLSENLESWVIESTPLEDSGYSKLRSTISKSYFAPTKVEYFDRRKEILKTSEIYNYKPIKFSSKDFFFPSEIQMINHQTNKKSIITWSERKIGINYSDTKFKSQKLK